MLAPPEMKLVNPRNVESVYSNNAALAMSPFDLRMLFSEIIIDGTSEPRLELRANIVLTLVQAKALQHALAKSVSGYEAQFGEISIPNAIITAVNPEV